MNFQHILFPIDFSGHCHGLNPEVEWLAARFGSTVTLLHVFEIPASWYGAGDAPLINPTCFRDLVQAQEEALQNYKLNLPAQRVERIIAEGNPASQIVAWANENGVDLVAMGTRGLGNVRGLLMGSVTAKVIHDVHCPVWTNALLREEPRSGSRDYKTIVCAIDSTEEAIWILQTADELARNLKAKVHVVHSVPGAETRPNKYFDFEFYAYLTDAARVAISKLQREAKTQFPVSITAAPVGVAVSDVALEQSADLIVIGRGKAGKSLGRLRTHAYEIIRDAPCAVLSCLREEEIIHDPVAPSRHTAEVHRVD